MDTDKDYIVVRKKLWDETCSYQAPDIFSILVKNESQFIFIQVKNSAYLYKNTNHYKPSLHFYNRYKILVRKDLLFWQRKVCNSVCFITSYDVF